MRREAGGRSPGLKRAIEAAGGVTALAEALGLNRSTVMAWFRVPTHRVEEVAIVTGLKEEELI